MIKTEELFKATRVLPVVVIKDIKETIPTLSALLNGGIPAAEITFRTECAAEAIRIGLSEFPNMMIGAGTIINKELATQAIEAGAKFIVSPGFSAEIVEVCRVAGVPYIPGCATPTEIMAALACGINVIKYFPANIYGGLDGVKSLSGPFPQVKFLPTGGVDLGNLKEFLDCDKIIAVGGSFMMKGDIEKNCQKIMEVIK